MKKNKKQLITIVNGLNKNIKTIKFAYQISSQKAPFLDTTVYKDKKNSLQTALYRKPTGQQSYVHGHSIILVH